MVSRNNVDFVDIVLETVKNGFGKRSIITGKPFIPSTGVILRAEDSR